MVVLLYMYMIFGFCKKKKKKKGKESQYMVSHPELGSDPPIGLDRESGRDTYYQIHVHKLLEQTINL